VKTDKQTKRVTSAIASHIHVAKGFRGALSITFPPQQ
jgi:hypothetical protein